MIKRSIQWLLVAAVLAVTGAGLSVLWFGRIA